MSNERTIIREGHTVIMDYSSDKRSFVKVGKKDKLKMGKTWVPTEPLIGQPYGSYFGLSADGQSLELVDYTAPADWAVPLPAETQRSNKDLLDANQNNQELTSEDIQAMKESGLDGAAIVEELTKRSATFDSKTEFAQEKYKKKKAKKHLLLACAARPSAAAVAETYHTSQPARVGFLRADTLAVLLSLANVGAGARALVVDTCGGLAVAAVAERLGGWGAVAAAHVGGRPPKQEALAQLNLGPEERAAVRQVPLAALLARRAELQSAGQAAGEPGPAAAQPAAAEAEPAAAPPAAPRGGQAEAPVQQAGAGGGSAQGAAGAGQQAGAGGSRFDPPFDSLILAAPGLDPAPTLAALLPLLAPSAPFAAYCPWAPPLAEAMDALRSDGLAVNLALQESWWRECQVLPSRTHPLMSMDHSGGYILSGTAVLPEPAGGQAGAKRQRT